MYKLTCVICGKRFELDQYYDVCSLECEQTRLGMTSDPTKNIVEYGQALVRALQAFEVLAPRGNWFEKLLIRILKASYQNRLRHLLLMLPTEASEAILRPDHRPGRPGLDAVQEEDVTAIEEKIFQFVRDSGGEAREFIAFTDLGYNQELGWFKKSSFPDATDECDPSA